MAEGEPSPGELIDRLITATNGWPTDMVIFAMSFVLGQIINGVDRAGGPGGGALMACLEAIKAGMKRDDAVDFLSDTRH